DEEPLEHVSRAEERRRGGLFQLVTAALRHHGRQHAGHPADRGGGARGGRENERDRSGEEDRGGGRGEGEGPPIPMRVGVERPWPAQEAAFAVHAPDSTRPPPPRDGLRSASPPRAGAPRARPNGTHSGTPASPDRSGPRRWCGSRSRAARSPPPPCR